MTSVAANRIPEKPVFALAAAAAKDKQVARIGVLAQDLPGQRQEPTLGDFRQRLMGSARWAAVVPFSPIAVASRQPNLCRLGNRDPAFRLRDRRTRLTHLGDNPPLERLRVAPPLASARQDKRPGNFGGHERPQSRECSHARYRSIKIGYTVRIQFCDVGAISALVAPGFSFTGLRGSPRRLLGDLQGNRNRP